MEKSVDTILLAGEEFARMSDLCSQAGVTPNTFIQGVWGFLLGKYNNTQDVVFGSVVSGSADDLVIPVRVKFNLDETIPAFLKRIQQETVSGHNHQEDIQAQAAYDFNIIVSPLPSSMKIQFKFNKNKCDDQLIKRAAGHLSNLIEQFSDGKNKQLRNARYLTNTEAQQVLADFNNTVAAYPRSKTIVDLFEEQVLKTPGNKAIIKDNGAITYDELNRIANQLSGYLTKEFGVIDGDVVAVKLERSEFLVISIFGILKSGAVYLPIDKNLPEKRIEYIKEDSRYKLIIDEAFIDAFIAGRDACSEENRTRKNTSADIAYIIYTSGTTGLPKGTLIEHHSLVNRLCWMQKLYSLSADDTILQKTSSSFDVSVWELLWWSIVGAKVVFLKDGYEKDPEQIVQYIARHSISVIHFVPSMLVQLLDFIKNDRNAAGKLISLKRVYASGEVLTSKINQQFHELFENARLINLYGPTEATIDVTYFECEKGLNAIPIGKPIDNTRIYILDKNHDILPVGIEGSIFIAGAGLARGYLNKPDLTDQRFLKDPFAHGERMYDTGDIGRWMPDGNIEYVGRDDDQVKIRGYRIELGEINQTLERIKGVNIAHVLKLEEKLVAFILFNGQEPAKPDAGFETYLRTELAKFLPDYMIPHHFCQIKEIPLSPSGKTDKKHLISIFQGMKDNGKVVNPVGELTARSREMAEIWSEVLGISINTIDPARSFIQQGGDSLTMLKVVAMCKKKGYPITIKEFLHAPYLNFLEGMNRSDLKDKKNGNARALDSQHAAFVLSPIQQFFFDNNKQGLKFIMHASYYINKGFSVGGIRRSLDAIINDHDSFRLRFKREKGLWRQKYDFDTTGYMLEIGESREGKTSLNRCIASSLEVIDIEKGPLLYANIFFEGAQPVLFLACHHLVMDAVSWKIFIDDLQINYVK